MSRKKHTIHRENCDNLIREIIKDMFDRTIVLSGKYAFEWSITTYDGSKATTVTYSSREKARKEFDLIKKLHCM